MEPNDSQSGARAARNIDLGPEDMAAIAAARRGALLPHELAGKLSAIVIAAIDGERIQIVHERVTSPALADAAMSAIKGGQDAQRLVFALKDGMAPADALLDGLHAVQATGDGERLRGFARELQKRLERV